MKKTVFAAFFLALAVPSATYAAGFVQHQFMAEMGAERVSSPELSACLEAYPDAYLMGSAFPDTGWVVFNDPMGNDTHSKAFINAFVDHIKATYTSPYAGQCQLISFMMGVAAHVSDDPYYHGGMIPASADHDFNGNEDLAHTFCDGGLDFLSIVDFDRWEDVPEYYVPLRDVMQVYARMGSSYPRWQIVGGNIVILILETAERWIAEPLHRPLFRIMPWTAANYYTYPDGGLYGGGDVAAAYYESTWATLMAPARVPPMDRAGRAGGLEVATFEPGDMMRENPGPLLEFARRCLDEGIVEVDVVENPDGSISLGQPRVVDMAAWEAGLEGVVRTYLE